jgi:hypothetical protein
VSLDSAPRVVGWLLIAGAVVFWIGALTPPYRQWMGVSLEEYLNIVGANGRNWQVMHALFGAGTLLTLIGLSGLTARLHGTGGGTWAAIGLTLFAVSAVLWFVQLGFRVAVTPWASSELAGTGHMPDEYVSMHRWMGVLFGSDMVLGYLAAAAYGLAFLAAPGLPRWAGWTAFCVGVVAVPGMITPLFQPPLMLEVVPFVLGIAIVRAPP